MTTRTIWVGGAPQQPPGKRKVRYDAAKPTLVQIGQFGYVYMPGKKYMKMTDEPVQRIGPGSGEFETSTEKYVPISVH